MSRNVKAAARPDGYHRRMASALRRDAVAMEALYGMGIGEIEVEDLGLALKEPYVRSDGTLVSGVLCYPLADGGGRARFGCVNLNGVTCNPDHAVAWSPGDPATVRRGVGEATLVVVESPLTAWRLSFAAARVGTDLAVIASSQPERIPAEWDERRFWTKWTRLLVSADLPAPLRQAIATASRRPIEIARASAPIPCGWGTRGHDDVWLADMLGGSAGVEGAPIFDEDAGDDAAGDFAAEPVSVHGGLSRGRLLYPFRVERRVRVGGRLNHSYVTLVLRADGAVLEAEVLPAPPGTPAHRRVHALTDGTRILAPPQPSRTSSWSLAGVRSYAEACLEGLEPVSRPAVDILHDVHDILASRVTLPHPADLWIAAGFVMVTHLFRLFEALPLLLICGDRGTGKSEMASAVAALSFNATVMGQGSAAALVRLADECGGLVVLDDVEGLAGDGGAFSELGQCLKVGYKAVTGRKAVSSPSGHVRVHDFYGPRVITTTRGVDPVLASRCLTIATAADPATRPDCDLDAAILRDELHALAMWRSADVASAYAPLATAAATRADEIAAPLLAVAEAFGCAPLIKALALAGVEVCERSPVSQRISAEPDEGTR